MQSASPFHKRTLPCMRYRLPHSAEGEYLRPENGTVLRQCIPSSASDWLLQIKEYNSAPPCRSE